jgi:xanthine dehydrogenase small subunit
VVLRKPDGQRRELPLADLYLGYKTLAKEDDELVVEIHFPRLAQGERFSFEKVSKRRCLDIATVNAAARLQVDDQGVITAARLALGGVAAVPLLLRQASAWLVGRALDVDTVRQLLDQLQGEISPISDVRGSAAYKRLLARQLTAAHFCKLYPEAASLDALLAQDQEVRP